MTENAFDSYHPIVNFIYFASVMLIAMLIMNPYFLAVGIVASMAYAILLKRKKIFSTMFGVILPMFLLICILNPLLTHRGMTILGYIGDNPITLEAIFYGIASASMLVIVVSWFICYSEIMNSEKTIYLFGKAVPSIALLLSMSLRLIPKFTGQFKRISQSQKLIGKNLDQGNMVQRAKNGLCILSILVTWALENSIETADSMKARGYGLKGRTFFSLFSFKKRDGILLFLISVCLFSVLILYFGKNGRCFYYPFFRVSAFSVQFMIMMALYMVLCFIPVGLQIIEGHGFKK